MGSFWVNRLKVRVAFGAELPLGRLVSWQFGGFQNFASSPALDMSVMLEN